MYICRWETQNTGYRSSSDRKSSTKESRNEAYQHASCSEDLTSSSPPVEKKETFDEFATHLKEISLDQWTVASSTDTKIRIVLNHNEHSIPKYALIIDSCLHFSLHVFNWVLPDQHTIDSSCRQRINSGGILELLQCLSNNKYKICQRLRETDYLNSIAKDPAAPSHIVHTVFPMLFATLSQKTLVWKQIIESW